MRDIRRWGWGNENAHPECQVLVPSASYCCSWLDSTDYYLSFKQSRYIYGGIYQASHRSTGIGWWYLPCPPALPTRGHLCVAVYLLVRRSDLLYLLIAAGPSWLKSAVVTKERSVLYARGRLFCGVGEPLRFV
jgi:hypothetical protein